MISKYENNAIVYCEGALTTTNGKTAHGLLRRSDRYRIISVVDSFQAGRSTGDIIRGCRFNVPIFRNVEEAFFRAEEADIRATHLIIGLAPDGGKLPLAAREHIIDALFLELHIVSGLHDFLSDDKELSILARKSGVRLYDLRQPPDPSNLHFFSGKIASVGAPRVAVLGTDSAVGKRTTAWMLTDEYRARDIPAELVGTGQTARLQGVKYGVVFDALVNDFVSGEIEHAVWSAWEHAHPEVIIVEGQGSLMNPAYPGGLEIMAASRPCCVVLQHAPARAVYDGFPDYPIHPIRKQIQAIELISEKPVVAVTINSEGLSDSEASAACDVIKRKTGLCAVDPLIHGVDAVIRAIGPHIRIAEDTTSIRCPKAAGTHWN